MKQYIVRVYQSFPRAFWGCVGAGALVNGFMLSWLLLKPFYTTAFITVDNILQTLGMLLGAVFCFLAIARSESSQGYTAAQRRSLLLVAIFTGLGCLCIACGQAIYTYYQQFLYQSPPFPGLSDAGYLGVYPFLFLGILSLPTRPISWLERSRIFLDGLLIMTAITAASWYFILGPTILQGYDSLFAKIVGAAYPFSDLVLMFCLLLLASRSSSPALRSTLFLLSLGLLIVVGTDSIYDLRTLSNAYFTGSWLDLGWPLGYTVIGLAIQALPWGKFSPAASEQPANAGGRQKAWSSLIAYALIPPEFVFVLVLWHDNLSGPLAEGVYLGAAILIGLIVVRQIFVIWETLHLNAALRRANLRLESMATTDPLTELPNHRALQSLLAQEGERACRYGRPFSLLFFDGDRFKQVNDTYGHAVGDIVLRELGKRARSVLRAGDTVGRFGGEEFLVILPETAEQEARTVAERLRSVVAALPLAACEIEGGIAVTVSIGVASYPDDGNAVNIIQEQADQAMYWAKRLGRNQVRTAAEAERANHDAALKAATAHALDRHELAFFDGRDPEQQLRAEQLRLVYSLMGVLDWREPGTNEHANEVSDLVAGMARLLGFDDQRTLRAATAAFLHDIGKIALPDRLLQQPRSHFSDSEWRLLQQHAELGAAIVEDSPWLSDLAPAIRHHHERWDGKGNPNGLTGEAIPLEARLIALAEAYHAIISERPYRAARTPAEALAELERCSGTQFDPALIPLLRQVLVSREQEQPSIQDLLTQV
jgi:two-component system cell cycle response regulator